MNISEKNSENQPVRANLIGTVLDIGISLLLGAIIVGNISLPAFYSVATSGFDAYTLLVWGVLPLVAVAAMLTAVYNRAKYAYTMS